MAAATLDINLRMQSNSFTAGAKAASGELRAMGGTAQRMAGGMGQVSALMGSALPMFGQFGGAVNQAAAMAADFAGQIGKGGVASALFAAGPAMAAVAAFALLSGTIEKLAQDQKRFDAAMESSTAAVKRFAEASRIPVKGGGLDETGQAYERQLVEAKKRQEELLKERKDLDEAGSGLQMADQQRRANQDNLDSLRFQMSLMNEGIRAARERGDEEKLITDELKEQAEWGQYYYDLEQKVQEERQTAAAEQSAYFDTLMAQEADAMEEGRAADAERASGIEELAATMLRGAMDQHAAEMTPAAAGKTGQARLIDRSLVSLEGLRMNADEPVALAKQANALAERGNALLNQIAMNLAGVP